MSPEEMDEYLAESGGDCAEHGPGCADEDCLTVEQEIRAEGIESAVEMGSMTETAARAAHLQNGTWDPNPDPEAWA